MINVVADHLSYLGPEATPSEELHINDSFPNEQLLVISDQATPRYADLVNVKLCGVLPPGLYHQQRKKFLSDTRYYIWEEPLLYKLCGDGVYKRCLPEDEVESVLYHCHAATYGGHFGVEKAIAKVLQVGFYWPIMFKDARDFVMTCNKCQQIGNNFKRHEIPQQGILEVELFDVWGIDFMGPFPPSYNNLYILVAVDCFKMGGSHCYSHK